MGQSLRIALVSGATASGAAAVALVSLLLVSAAVAGPLVDVDTKLEPQKAPFGTSLSYEVVLTVPKKVKFEPPEAESIEFDEFEVRDAFVTELPPTETARKWRYSFRLARYEPGRFTVVPPTWKFEKDGRDLEVEGEPLEVELVGVEPLESDKPGEIRGLKPHARTPIPLIFYLLGVAALILVGWVLRGVVRGLMERRSKAPPEVVLTPYQWAHAQLEQLEEAGLLARGQTQLFSEKLADILRGYLARKHRLPVLERTTSELVKVLKEADFAEEKRKRIKGILELADLVKFAKREPTENEAREQLKQTSGLLEEEEQQPEVEAQDEAL